MTNLEVKNMARPDSGQCLLDCHEDAGGGGGAGAGVGWGDYEGMDRLETLGGLVQDKL